MDTRYSPEQVELRSATAALVADLGPRTVVDLDDGARQARLAEAGGVGGLVRPHGGRATTTHRWHPASTWRSWPGSWAGSRPTPRSSDRWSPPISPDALGAVLDDGAAAMVLDPTLADLAVVPAGGPAEGVAVDCAGMTRALLVAADGGTACRIVAAPIADAAPATDLTRALGRGDRRRRRAAHADR